MKRCPVSCPFQLSQSTTCFSPPILPFILLHLACPNLFLLHSRDRCDDLTHSLARSPYPALSCPTLPRSAALRSAVLCCAVSLANPSVPHRSAAQRSGPCCTTLHRTAAHTPLGPGGDLCPLRHMPRSRVQLSCRRFSRDASMHLTYSLPCSTSNRFTFSPTTRLSRRIKITRAQAQLLLKRFASVEITVAL